MTCNNSSEVQFLPPLAYYVTLKMESTCSSETSGTLLTTRRQKSERCTGNAEAHEDLRSNEWFSHFLLKYPFEIFLTQRSTRGLNFFSCSRNVKCWKAEEYRETDRERERESDFGDLVQKLSLRRHWNESWRICVKASVSLTDRILNPIRFADGFASGQQIRRC
jgi:hypothetical protein